MEVEIIKEKRKTMVLKVVSDDRAILKAPKNLSDEKIIKFIENKKNWLNKIAEKISANKQFSMSFDLDKFIYLDGKQFVSVDELSLDFDKQPQTKKRKTIEKFYLSHFDKLVDIANQISAHTGLKFNEIKPTSSTRIWGSYNSGGVMKLNWKLLILPQHLAEYVVAHELCHSLHMNHKPKFWADVKKICPNYKAYRKELQKYGFLLKNDKRI